MTMNTNMPNLKESCATCRKGHYCSETRYYSKMLSRNVVERSWGCCQKMKAAHLVGEAPFEESYWCEDYDGGEKQEE